MKKFVDIINKNIEASLTNVDNRGKKKVQQKIISGIYNGGGGGGGGAEPDEGREVGGDFDSNAMVIESELGKKKTCSLEDNIMQLQSEMIVRSSGGGAGECEDPMFHFLDLLNIPRRETNTHMFTTQKAKFEEQILLLPESRRIILLRSTLTFLRIDKLKFLPLLVMKSMTTIPDRLQEYIVNFNVLSDFCRCSWELFIVALPRGTACARDRSPKQHW